MRPSLSHPLSAEAAAHNPSRAEAAVQTLDSVDDKDISHAIFADGESVDGSGVLIKSSDNDNEILGYNGGGVKLGGVVETNNRPPSLDHSEYSVTTTEVMKFAFVERLHHYMTGALIGLSNRSAVEACIFMEVGTAISDLDTMKVPQMEELFFRKYMAVVGSIPNNLFIDESVRLNMLERYLDAKKINTCRSLFRKYKVWCMRGWGKIS